MELFVLVIVPLALAAWVALLWHLMRDTPIGPAGERLPHVHAWAYDSSLVTTGGRLLFFRCSCGAKASGWDERCSVCGYMTTPPICTRCATPTPTPAPRTESAGEVIYQRQGRARVQELKREVARAVGMDTTDTAG